MEDAYKKGFDFSDFNAEPAGAPVVGDEEEFEIVDEEVEDAPDLGPRDVSIHSLLGGPVVPPPEDGRPPEGWEDLPWPFQYPHACERPGTPAELQLQSNMLPPQESLYHRYFAWANQSTDVPNSLHWGCLTTVLGAILGPGHIIRHGNRKMVPNLYTLLVVESGQRKSHAIDLATQFVPHKLVTSIVPQSMSAFVDQIKETAWLLMALDEAGALYRTMGSGASWTATLSHAMIEVFDGKPLEIRTRKAGKEQASVECISLLGATTEDSLRAIPAKELRALAHGGLLSRTLICTAHIAEEAKRYHEPLPHEQTFERAMRDVLYRIWQKVPAKPVASAPHLQRPAKEYRLSHAARVELWRWAEQMGPKPPTPALVGTWNRLTAFAKKIALIYHVSMGRDHEHEIDAPTFVAAANVLSYYLIPAFRYFIEGIGETEYQSQVYKLVDLLRSAPNGIPNKDLPKLMGMRPDNVWQAMAPVIDDIHVAEWAYLTADGKSRAPGRSHLIWSIDRPIPSHNAQGEPSRPGEMPLALQKPKEELLPAGLRQVINKMTETRGIDTSTWNIAATEDTVFDVDPDEL